MVHDQPPWWRPDVFAKRRANLLRRAQIADDVRRWFRAAGFVEVETPALQVSPGMEPHLEAFVTRMREPDERDAGRPLYLHTSPEFAMKKLVAAGMPKIFQLAHAFRNAERSATHHPEFTMLEWYRADAGWRDTAEDCLALLRVAGTELRRGAQRCDPALPAQWISVAEAFRQHADVDLFGDLAAQAQRIGVRVADGDPWDDVFFRIFLERVEPKLGQGAPTILHSYPASMAALARIAPGDPRIAERFELFVCGLELANGFGELTDAAEQRTRFMADDAKRRALYGRSYPLDEDLLAALEHGLPRCSGVALGFDRLVMLATGAATIDDVLWAPVAAAPPQSRG
jgi:lysyl-tRNA synthetase class 2